MASISRWGLRDGFKLAKTVGKELNNPAQYSPEEFIAAAQRAMAKNPNEWVIYYSIADEYQKLGFYAQALEATKKCVKLKPNDIRSTYAHATSYNILSRAAWTEREDQLSKVIQLLGSDIDKFSKQYAQAGLDHTGIAIETAALQAIRWFEKSLSLKPDIASKNQINADLRSLYRRFPHLKR